MGIPLDTAGFLAACKKANGKELHQCKLLIWEGDPQMKMREIVRFICDECCQNGGALQTLLYIPEVHSLDELERLRTGFPAALHACGAVGVVVYSSDGAAKQDQEQPSNNFRMFRKKYQI